MVIEGEVYLIKDCAIDFNLVDSNASKIKTGWFRQSLVGWAFLPVDSTSESDTTLTRKLNDWMNAQNQLYSSSRAIQLSFRNRSEELENTVTFQPKTDLIETSVRSDFLCPGIRQMLGQDTKLRIEIRNAQAQEGGVAINYLAESYDAVMTRKQQNHDVYYSGVCKFPQHWALYWNSNMRVKYSAEVSVIAVCGQVDSSKRIKLDEGPIQGLLNAENVKLSNKKLLDDGIGTDTTIITGEGSKVRCHKCFLMVESPVIAQKLQGIPQDGLTHEIKLDDMSDKGVKAFLAFLYYRDISAPFSDPQVALELLVASQKFTITILENAMKALLGVKPLSWFDIPSALGLYFFAKNVDSLSQLKEKALNVLKTNKTQFVASEEYKELFARDDKREAVKELLTALLKM